MLLRLHMRETRVMVADSGNTRLVETYEGTCELARF